ncbi:MAG: hypothetical protein M3Y55_15950 [Pseudomonadota bacterium]|nr:hypothetical protein [Pseudomonadota bacterium]
MTPYHRARPLALICVLKKSLTQRGQSSMEYTVVCAALALTLGIGMVDDTSVLHELIEALKLAYQKISFAISLPT